MSGHIVAVGSINMDLVIRTPHHPQLGETVMGGSFQTFPGGKGANESVAAARLGATVKLIGCVGTDGFGDALLQTIRADKIDTTYIRQHATMPTGVAFILVDDTTGQNNIVLAEGANGSVTAKTVSESEKAFEGASVLTLNLECTLEAIERAVELAQKYSVRVVFNPAPYQPLPRKLLADVDYLILNQIEIISLLGRPIPVEDHKALSAAVKNMQADKLLRNVIVTLGEDGSLAIPLNEEATHLPAYAVKAVDTVAAGDAFVGAFAVAISEGYSTLEAARWGNAAGALAVTKSGAQPSLPTRAEFNRFLQR